MVKTDNTALMVMDVQPGVIDMVEDKEDYLKRIKEAVDVAHKSQIQVIYVVVGFRPGFPEVSPNNKSFSTIKENTAINMIDPLPVVEPTGTDLVIIKHRVSAFSGSDLDMILRASDITHLVLSGIATSGVVLSTLREAADRDFKLTVLSDLCADRDEQVQELLLDKVFPRQANILTTEEWMKAQ